MFRALGKNVCPKKVVSHIPGLVYMNFQHQGDANAIGLPVRIFKTQSMRKQYDHMLCFDRNGATGPHWKCLLIEIVMFFVDRSATCGPAAKPLQDKLELGDVDVGRFLFCVLRQSSRTSCYTAPWAPQRNKQSDANSHGNLHRDTVKFHRVVCEGQRNNFGLRTFQRCTMTWAVMSLR